MRRHPACTGEQSRYPCSHRRGREAGLEKTILFGLTGTGYFDMAAYGQYNDGRMTDHVPSEEELQRGFASIPRFPGNL